jgi:hypothetical protein
MKAQSSPHPSLPTTQKYVAHPPPWKIPTNKFSVHGVRCRIPPYSLHNHFDRDCGTFVPTGLQWHVRLHHRTEPCNSHRLRTLLHLQHTLSEPCLWQPDLLVLFQRRTWSARRRCSIHLLQRRHDHQRRGIARQHHNRCGPSNLPDELCQVRKPQRTEGRGHGDATELPHIRRRCHGIGFRRDRHQTHQGHGGESQMRLLAEGALRIEEPAPVSVNASLIAVAKRQRNRLINK